MSMLENYRSKASTNFFLYILNNLEKSSIYHEDLFLLFGSEDASRKGLAGRWDRRTNDFKTECWDWSVSNLRSVINLLYYLVSRKKKKAYDPKEFDDFYRKKIKYCDDIIELLRTEGIIDRLLALYVLRYKKQFPALVLEIERLKWEQKGKLLITFKPIKYFILDPETWNTIKEKTRDENFWLNIPDFSKNEDATRDLITKYVSGQRGVAIYGLLPLSKLRDYLLRASVFLVKDVQKEGENQVISENQIFWEFFRIFTQAKQETALVALENDYRYEMEKIPINSLTKRTLTYAQEAGVPNVLCHILLETFGDRYLDVEFKGRNKITQKEAIVLRRAFPVYEIYREKNNRYADSDYDYALNLEPLGVHKKLLFDLTTALWKKGHTSYDELLQKWKEMYFGIPSRHDECSLIWYITVDTVEKTFFRDNESHKDFLDLLNTLMKDVGKSFGSIVRDTRDLKDIKNSKVVIIALFRDAPNAGNVKRELENLRRKYLETIFYKAVKTVFSLGY